MVTETWRNAKAVRSPIPSAARKSEGVPLSDPSALSAFAPPPPGANVPVTEDTALNLSGCWSATRVITGAVSILPLHVHEKRGDGERDRVEPAASSGRLDVRVAARVASNPCPEMGPLTFWETLVAHALNRGNGYAEIEEDGAGNPVALWPLLPFPFTRPMRDPQTKELYYETSTPWGNSGRIAPRHVFHLAGLGFDGLQGYSVVSLARRSLGLTATAEQAGEQFMGNGMRPGGWVEFTGSLQDWQKLNADESLQKKHGGAAKFGKALVMYGGMKYHQLDISPDDAQFLETREFQTEEIARWYNVPPHKIKQLKRATFSNIEHQGQEFVTDTLLYWLTKITQEFGRKLLSRYFGGREDRYYAEHVTDALMRGDTIARYTAYGLGRQWGFLSPNDCRRKENMPPVANGDTYHVAVNMVELGTKPQPAAEPVREEPTGPSDGAKATAAAIATAAAREVCERDAAELEQLAEGDPDVFAVWCQRAGLDSWEWVTEALEVRCRAVSHQVGHPVDAAVIAAEYAARRLAQVRHFDDRRQTGYMADAWRADVEWLRDLILSG